jgi:hypothetical protein
MAEQHFSSSFAVTVYIQPLDHPNVDWILLDQGPAYFTIPTGNRIKLRIRQIGDHELRLLTKEVSAISLITHLDLAENRNITDRSLEFLIGMPDLTYLNLSSCDITNQGLEHLQGQIKLRYLDLSYCNRLNDFAVKTLRSLTSLTELNLLGVLSITTAGFARLQRRGLLIHRK